MYLCIEIDTVVALQYNIEVFDEVFAKLTMSTRTCATSGRAEAVAKKVGDATPNFRPDASLLKLQLISVAISHPHPV